jgi:glycine/D-amino acid oxidase-like deaminating enzyme/nitrite reductase/ring-hydroxylating ferredoxin subunit
MDPREDRTRTLWRSTVTLPTYERLRENAMVDVCIVGAGIAGLTTAYLLTREGLNVLVLDDGDIGGGETGNTTAHLSNAFDDRFVDAERLFGERGARLLAESHGAAIRTIEEIAARELIDCDFARVDGYLFPRPGGEADVQKEERAARMAGIDVALTQRPPYDPFHTGPALCFPAQARFHPLKYLAGVAQAVARHGRICTGTKVTAIHGGAPVTIETAGGATVTARACVVATNAAISDMVQTHAKSAPYRTFVVALTVPHGSVPDALYWDDSDPYTYIRLQPGADHDHLIVGGEDYKTGQESDDAERLQRLERWTRERFPMASALAYAWSGQVIEPDDYAAFIGPNPDGAENVYIITGDSGQGMTHGTLGAMLLTDLIQGRPNEWAELYDPRRITLGAAKEYLAQNLNVAVQYTDYAKPGEVGSPEEVASGTGRTMRRGAKIVAVYRDPDGFVHERSAVCTHMKCIVAWNDLEKSWDCPCHGSRFDPYGRVLNGPAVEELGPAD